MNQTIRNFGHPETVVKEYTNWVVMLRPKQVTLGSLVLAEKSDAESYADISDNAMAEQQRIIRDIESNLKAMFGAEKFNYLMLMMVDPNVHFHVLPRYSQDKEFQGKTFTDPNWSGPPDLKKVHDLSDDEHANLLQHLRAHWVCS